MKNRKSVLKVISYLIEEGFYIYNVTLDSEKCIICFEKPSTDSFFAKTTEIEVSTRSYISCIRDYIVDEYSKKSASIKDL